MTLLVPALGKIWLAVGIHLWQTSLFLVPILLLSRWMRAAPARVLHLLWSIALIKVLIPVSLLADLAKRVPASSLLRDAEGTQRAGAVALDAVFAVLRPEGIVQALTNGLAGGLAILPVALTILWAIGAVYAIARLVRRRAGSPNERPASLDLLGEESRSILDRALRGTAIPPGFVRLSRTGALPHVVGWFAPRIVLPASLLESLRPSELRAVLLHEEAHRRRRDPLRGALLEVLRAVLFFYPPVRVLVRKIQDTTELVCDERVVEFGVSGEAYARALAKTLRLGLFPSTRPFAAGVGGGSLLRVRFERISTPGRFSIMTRHRIIVGAVVLLVLAGAFLPSPLVAGDSEKAVAKGKASEASPKSEFTPLDTMPASIKQVPPVYPEAEKKDGIAGEVQLKMYVSASGTVDSLIVAKGVEGHPAFEVSAVTAARQWIFKPGEMKGKAVACWVQVPFVFRLN